MKNKPYILFLGLLLLLNSCIVQFIPKTSEDKDILVVEGLITDNYGPNTIKLSKSNPLGGLNAVKPLTGCIVTVTDDNNNSYAFTEAIPGSYLSDPGSFQGVIGSTYIMHISTNKGNNSERYESNPEELLAVPPIDSVYYEKQTIVASPSGTPEQQGCQIYLDTHDASNKAKFYRWEYAETWEFSLPYYVPNKTCWISDNSDIINIKNTSVFAEDKIFRHPLNFISNATDRLRVEYSVLVKQYSMNEAEYTYWDKLQNLSQQAGGLYDIIPSSVPSNIYSLDDPAVKVLGYFSVSGMASRRLFVKDNFAGLVDLYTNCEAKRVPPGTFIENLNISVWIIVNHGMPDPYWAISYSKDCADCTTRGTTTMPAFWLEGKNELSK